MYLSGKTMFISYSRENIFAGNKKKHLSCNELLKFKNMKKLISIAFICILTLSLASCGNKKQENRTEQRMENAKESVKNAVDRGSEKMEEGVDKTKDAWNETKEDFKDGAQQMGNEIKENYQEVKKDVKKKLD